MKKIFIICIVCVFVLCSCKTAIIPRAVNTVNSVSLSELNLERQDYVITNTITAEATITYRYSKNRIKITEENDECEIVFKRQAFRNLWYYHSFDGIARYGFLTNDYEGFNMSMTDDIKPEYIVRNLAIYRLINACKTAGGDGVIEPIISTNVEQKGHHTILFKTTVSAKVIKLKSDGK